MDNSNEGNTGARLRYEREKQGLSVIEISRQLHLSERVVHAIENDEHDQLPAVVYVRGYIRSYCRLLKIPYSEVLSDFSPRTDNQENEIFLLTTSEKTHQLIRVWGSLVVISVIIILVGLWWMKQNELAEHMQSSPEPKRFVPEQDAGLDKHLTNNDPFATSPALTTPLIGSETTVRDVLLKDDLRLSTPTAPSTESKIEHVRDEPDDSLDEPDDSLDEPDLVRFTIYADDVCWVHISDGQGQSLIRREVPAGYRKTVEGYSPFNIKLGRASVVQIWVNDESYDLNRHTISSLDTLFFTLSVPEPDVP